MKKSKLTEVQILKILSLSEHGRSVTDLCREYGISQYKKIVAELTLQNRVLKDVIEKKL